MIERLRSAEPRLPGDDEITNPTGAATSAKPPEWVTQLAEQRRAFQENEERQNVLIPDEDPDYGFVGQAWPWQERDPDAILQPPKPELRPCAGIERIAVTSCQKGKQGVMRDQNEAARRMAFFQNWRGKRRPLACRTSATTPTAPATATPATGRATARQRSP